MMMMMMIVAISATVLTSNICCVCFACLNPASWLPNSNLPYSNKRLVFNNNNNNNNNLLLIFKPLRMNFPERKAVALFCRSVYPSVFIKIGRNERAQLGRRCIAVKKDSSWLFSKQRKFVPNASFLISINQQPP